MARQTVTVDLDKDLMEALGSLGARTAASAAWHLQEAVRRYVAQEEAFLAAVNEGLRDLAAGNVIAHETIVTEFERRRERRGAAEP